MENKDAMYYLEKAPVPKAIAHMAIPMILGMVVNMIYNITDAYFIGRLNNTSMLASITLALPFTTILMALGELFGTGGSTYISRLLGEKKLDFVKIVSSVTLYLSLISGFLFMLICIPFLFPLLKLLGATGETLLHTRSYIIAYTIGSPFVVANFALAQMVRSEGASTESMIGMVISVIVNILLDPVFIFLFHMDVMGASVATVIGNISAVAYYIYYLEKKSPAQSVRLKYFKPNRVILLNIFKIGISALLLSGFLIVSSLMFNNYAVLYGDHVVAAFGVANRVCQISDFIGMGLYMGVVPLIAFSYASNNIERLNKVLKTTAFYLVTIIFMIAAVLFVFRTQVLELFSSDETVIKVGVIILTALLFSTLFAGISGLLTSMFQAFGKSIQSTIMSVSRGIALIPIIIIGNSLFQLNGVIWSMTVSEICTCFIGLLLWSGSKKEILNGNSKECAAR
ncbi:putative MATE family efflux protein [Lacrimispora xylanisolvens]|uniref:Multidrug export protein MepA n=1 Tax=Lacrimispora xylanisolvens TaxID=384636 RepID=A0A2S6HSU2_9FIRM|nr:MATE family efflux transporter [Hungatella xylanolytica]PPK80813.1 putative MATE family efflux protein [Hungatella xylanolytica]